MLLGEPARLAPTLQVATWDPFDDPIGSPFSSLSPSSANAGAGGDFFLDSLSALHRFLPSNNNDSDSDLDMPLISCDQFRMFEFKVRRCARGRSHDWTECPYAHPREKTRRRDPRKYHYSGSACPDFRKVRISLFLFPELEVASAKQNRHPRKQHQMKTLIMMKKSQSITISNL